MLLHLSAPSNSALDQATAPDPQAVSERSGATCPLCGHSGGKKWLEARDRFHGRAERYLLLCCPGCSLVWLSNAPAPEEMHHHYTDSYHRLISHAGETSPHRWEAHGKKLTQYKQSGAILDLGCSSGAFLESLKGQSWKRYGIEMSTAVAERASARTGAEVFVGDILNAPFPKESFDVITCFDVLEHLYEPLQVVTK